MDNAIHWIKLYPVDKAIGFANTYPLDSDLSSREHYPTCEQPGPVHTIMFFTFNLLLYSQSSCKQPPWKFEKVVTTRAGCLWKELS